MDEKKPSASNAFWVNLANLLKVKTLITLTFTALLILATLKNVDVPSEVMIIATNVITYFFTKQERTEDAKGRKGGSAE